MIGSVAFFLQSAFQIAALSVRRIVMPVHQLSESRGCPAFRCKGSLCAGCFVYIDENARMQPPMQPPGKHATPWMQPLQPLNATPGGFVSNPLCWGTRSIAGIEHSSDEWTNVLNIAEEYERYINTSGATNGIITQDTAYIRNLYQELSREHRI